MFQTMPRPINGGGTELSLLLNETNKVISSSPYDTGISASKVRAYFLNTKNLTGYGCAGVVVNGTVTELTTNGWIQGTVLANGNLGFTLMFSGSAPSWTCDINIFGID